MSEFHIKDIADYLQLQITGTAECRINWISDIKEPVTGSIVYINDKKNLPLPEASAYLCDISLQELIDSQVFKNKAFLFSKNSKFSFMKLLEFFQQHLKLYSDEAIESLKAADIDEFHKKNIKTGSNLHINPSANIGKNSILMGNNYIGKDVKIGENVILHPGVVIENRCSIGDNTIIHANTVIGSDGFGYENIENQIYKIPQIGNVKIGSNVEIGSNVSIDRATIGSTVIGDNCKIDNLVQIAHNVKIGFSTIIAGGTLIGGSAIIGNGVLIAGKAGIGDHAVINDGAILAAGSGVMSKGIVDSGSVMYGSPVQPIMKQKRIEALLRKLPELFQDIKEIKKKQNI